MEMRSQENKQRLTSGSTDEWIPNATKWMRFKIAKNMQRFGTQRSFSLCYEYRYRLKA